jgi:hypothetical protein
MASSAIGRAAQVAQIGEERRPVEQRRQEDQQDEVGVELHVRNARDEADHRAAGDQRYRVGHPSFPASTARPATPHSSPKMISSTCSTPVG